MEHETGNMNDKTKTDKQPDFTFLPFWVWSSPSGSSPIEKSAWVTEILGVSGGSNPYVSVDSWRSYFWRKILDSKYKNKYCKYVRVQIVHPYWKLLFGDFLGLNFRAY